MSDGAAVLELELETKRARHSFGDRLRVLRLKRRWTLSELSGRSGVGVSTISKAERGHLSLTFDSLTKLARGFGIDVSELTATTGDNSSVTKVAVTRDGKAERIENQYYVYDILCTDRARKKMVPILGRIKAHSIEEFDHFIRHPGEEFLYVLDGKICVKIDGKKPINLYSGDSIYFDSDKGHKYISSGSVDAKVLVVCCGVPSEDF